LALFAMDPCFLGCLRLEDDFGTKRWLATQRVSWRLTSDGAYECERVRPICLEINLHRLVDPGNSSSGLGGFVMRARFDLGGSGWLRNDDLVREVMASVEAGRLVVIRETGERTADPLAKARAEAWRIAREVERLSKGKLRSSGRRYTLCARGQLDRGTLGLTRRRLLPREALSILDRMIVEYAAQPELVAQLTEARKLFSADARQGDKEAELILLRHLIVAQPRGLEQAPITPSQIREIIQEKTQRTLEVVVLDHRGQPLGGLGYSVCTPDGETVSGKFGGGAKTKATSQKTGEAEVRLVPPEPAAADA
jgi:hypothetical protein